MVPPKWVDKQSDVPEVLLVSRWNSLSNRLSVELTSSSGLWIGKSHLGMRWDVHKLLSFFLVVLYAFVFLLLLSLLATFQEQQKNNSKWVPSVSSNFFANAIFVLSFPRKNLLLSLWFSTWTVFNFSLGCESCSVKKHMRRKIRNMDIPIYDFPNYGPLWQTCGSEI